MPRVYLAVREEEDQGKNQQGECCSAGQATDDNSGQGTGAFGADAGGQCGGEQADGGHKGCHQHRADELVDPQFDRRIERAFAVADMIQVTFEGGNEQNAFQDTDAEQCNETYTGRDAEVSPRDQQGEDAANHGKGDVEEDQPSVFEVAKHDEEQKEDQQEADGDDFLQAFGGALLVLEVALPDH